MLCAHQGAESERRTVSLKSIDFGVLTKGYTLELTILGISQQPRTFGALIHLHRPTNPVISIDIVDDEVM